MSGLSSRRRSRDRALSYYVRPHAGRRAGVAKRGSGGRVER